MQMYLGLFLTFASLSTTDFIVERKDEGDWFVWNNTHIICSEFSRNTAYYGHDDGCQCNHKLTFSTESNQCQSYSAQVHYMFKRSQYGENHVSAVYAVCGENNLCFFMATVTDTILPIATQRNLLSSNDNCVINFVDVIHNNCMPQRVDVDLSFTSLGSDKLYLQFHKTTPLSYFEGEVFQADVTCRSVGNGKLMFKFNGTRILTHEGSFPGIPPYDPAASSCSTLTVTASSASTHTTSMTSSVDFSSIPTASPVSAGRAHGFKYLGLTIGFGVGFICIIMLTAVTIIGYFFVRRIRHPYREMYAPNPLYEGGPNRELS